ncbi:hypothetical protein Tco_1035766, partial [Tanacetum coccineum]
ADGGRRQTAMADGGRRQTTMADWQMVVDGGWNSARKVKCVKVCDIFIGKNEK